MTPTWKTVAKTMRSGAALTVLCALAVPTAGTAAVAAPVNRAPVRASHTSHLSADAVAMERAIRTHRPVTVAADTTQTSLTIAHPNGMFTTMLSPVPVRVRAGGRWQRVNPTLHRTSDGTWVPQAVPSAVTLSGGGSELMATLTSPAGARLALTFPARLPAPVVSGATATYRSVLPGVDLRVTVNSLGGISDLLIIHDAAAAASPTLSHLHWVLTATGMRASTDATGNLTASTSSGAVQFTSPPTLAWDSTHHTTQVPARLSGHILTLTPVTGLFPHAVYPAYVSASVAAVGPSKCQTTDNQTQECTIGFDETQQGCPRAKNFDSTATGDPAIGYDDWTGGCSPGQDYSYYIFDTGVLRHNMEVIDATLSGQVTYGADFTCTDKWPVRLKLSNGYKTLPPWRNVDWADQPAVSKLNQTQATSVHTGPNPNSKCATQPFTIGGLKYAITDAVDQRWPNLTMRFSGTTDNGGTPPGSYGFLRLSTTPSIVVTFDYIPNLPANLTTAPVEPHNTPGGPGDNGCGASSPASYGWLDHHDVETLSLAATISAYRISDEPVYAGYTATDDTTGQAIQDPAGIQSSANPDVGYGTQTVIGSGTATTPVNPTFTLTDGHTYSWTTFAEVRGVPHTTGYPDGPFDSNAVPSCGFKVDLTPPTDPKVASAAFPPSGSTTPGQAGTSGIFTFTSTDPAPTDCPGSTGCQASGVYEFEYSLNHPLPANYPTPGCTDGQTSGTVMATTANGTATARSCSVPVSQWGTNTLYVAAIDNAGNISQAHTYSLYAAWKSTTTIAPGDINGDSIPDLLGTTGSDLILYPGDTDPAAAPLTAGTMAQSPDGTAWDTFQVTHRGSMELGTVDDLFAHKGAYLYLYLNGGGPQDQFNDDTTTTVISYPTHPACSAPTGDPTNCDSYATGQDWSDVTQILAPGDAWAGATTCEKGAQPSCDTGYPSLLTVENGALWLYQGQQGNVLGDPILLSPAGGSTNWANMTLIAPGQVNGQLTLWARANTTGTIYAYPVSLTSGVPTLGSGSVVSGVTLPASTYPAVASPGPLDNSSYPGLYAETTSGTAPSGTSCTAGCLYYYPGQSTAGGTQSPLNPTPVFVGVLSTPVNQLS